MPNDPAEPLFHGKFIPDDPHRLPLPLRLMIGVGLGLLILVLAFVSLNILNSWGVWVTFLLIGVMTATSLALWIRDAVLHPATMVDEAEAA
jgi:hypothetical protein